MLSRRWGARTHSHTLSHSVTYNRHALKAVRIARRQCGERWITDPAQSPPPLSPNATPVAYEDFGRNQPKVFYYLPTTPPQSQPRSSAPTTLQAVNAQNDSRSSTIARSDADIVLRAFVQSSVARTLLTPVRSLLQLLLPKNYPHSVNGAYASYTKWSFLQSVSSCAGGVISIQCLLFAMGLGQPLAVPAAAAIQWVLKDGLGQLGGMVFASYVNVSFDSDAKRWRMKAAMMLDAATTVEILTPLLPALFLPMAAIANMGKNIAWISATASRAGIHRSFVREENLADVTAKAASQTIAASLIGTAMGIALSYFIGTNSLAILAVFSCLSATHLTATYNSLCSVPLSTINDQRGGRIFLAYIDSGSVPTVEWVRQQETILWKYSSPLNQSSTINSQASFGDCVHSFQALTICESDNDGVSVSEALARLCRLYEGEKFFVTASVAASASRVAVCLLMQADAGSEDVLSAHLMAAHLRHAVNQLQHQSNAPISAALLLSMVEASLQWIRANRARCLQQLVAEGWNVEHLFLERDRQRRVQILRLPRPTTPGGSSCSNSNNSEQ